MIVNSMRAQTVRIWFFFLFTFYSFSIQGVDEQIGKNSQTSTQDEIKICLTMIVRNESKIIERCLNSAKKITDCISICDTGSTDNTIEIIEQFMQKNQLPGKVHQHVWKNFGHNRTLSIQAAQETLQEFHLPLAKTYLLLLDADMLLEIEPTFNKNTLVKDSYYFLQKNHSLSYYNTRLVRASLPWQCIGVTHEYWSCKSSDPSEQFSELKIDDRNDGGCKSDKFERDIKLLTQGLQDEPDNERYMFYLGQSYRCIGNFDQAIRWYKARIAKGGWLEEIWYSKCMIGEMYEKLGFWDHALHWYLDAYQENPKRAESLQKISTHYRANGQPILAYLFAKHGKRIPYPHDQLLFISDSVYNYQFDEDISIAAYYIPTVKEEGFEAADRLALKKDTPDHIREQTYKNIVFYAENLKDTKFQKIEFELPPIREGMNESYYPTNASIQKTTNGYQLLCRTVNFIFEGMSFKSRDPLDDSLHTRNFLLYYDNHFNLLSQKEITEDFPREHHRFKIKGLEDGRLFTFNHQLWFICTTGDTHESIGQTLCQLADESSDKIIRVQKFLPLKMPNPNRHEKNWLPLIKDQELLAIYSYDPWIIYKIDPLTGEHKIAKYNPSPSYNFSRFRGSAAPIEFDDGYLILVHEVIYSDNRNYYLHRFLFLDKELNINKISKPFLFKHKGVEYCVGMTMDHSGSQCILPISIEEREAWLCQVPLDTIRSLLRPLGSF